MSTQIRIARITLRSSLVLVVVCFLYTWALEVSYVYRPDRPEPGIGRVYLHTVKNMPRYLTHSEVLLNELLLAIQLGGVAIVGVLTLIYRPEKLITRARVNP
jgi:hypothetical protein